MKKTNFFLGGLLLLFLGGTALAQEVLVNTQEGETFIFEIDPSESLGALQDKIAAFSDGNAALLIEYPNKGRSPLINFKAARNPGGYLGYPRNYLAEVTTEEKNYIRFIVTTLANKSLITIALAKGDLEEAGDRIDHIHPLRFLMTVFTDEELKVGIRNIRGKGWVWGHFLGGLKECLATETQIGNMKKEYITNFSQIVKINSTLIQPVISQQKWDDFVDLLITHIPREGEHDRYDS
jgi:hypothetical protein